MAASTRYLDDVPEVVERRLDAICRSLPDAVAQQAWKGTRWTVRSKTFASVLGVQHDGADPITVLCFRSEGDELEVFRHAGHPFFVLGWGRDAIGMVLDATTDWDEVREVVTDSYCVMAPKKLVARVDRPAAN